MLAHALLSKYEVFQKTKNRKVLFGGNKRLKIYGTLKCKSEKRMKVINRVFFKSKKEAVLHDYRPCGQCLPLKYKEWFYNAI